MEDLHDHASADAQQAQSAYQELLAELGELRARARHLLRDQRDRARQVETTIAIQLGLLQAELRRRAGDEGGGDEQLRDEIAQLQQQIQSQHEEIEHLRNELAQRNSAEDSPPAVESAYVAQLESERDQLVEEVEQTRQELTAARDHQGEHGESNGELTDRLEMALEEIRELKEANEQLKEQLASQAQMSSPTPPSSSPGTSAASDGFDWEAQKQRLLAELDEEYEPEDEQQQKDRLTIESAIQITDQVVADKEREIAELKQLLESQTGNLGDVAIGAAAFGEIVDKDELIREERENLKRLQDEWREKLRKAEVEISVERAKIARERVELEEKMRQLELKLAQESPSDTPEESSGKTRTGGRWLARLGLKEDNR